MDGGSRATDLTVEATGRASAWYARVMVKARWWVITFWIAAVVAVTMFLPPFGSGGDEIASIIPLDSPAIRAELRSVAEFGYPLSSRTAVVQRDPNGLNPFAQAESVLDALAVNQSPQDYPMLGALPITNTFRLFPSSREENTTVLTYLFMYPTSGFSDQQLAAHRYIEANLTAEQDSVVGVTGSVPARAEQARLVSAWIPTLEVLTLLAILVLVGLNFRAILPPLVAMVAAAVAFLVTLRFAGLLGTVLGISVPAELEPLLVALLLGVVTDYTIFYLSAARNRLAAGDDTPTAMLRAIRTFTPIVAIAGITVASGTAALLAAQSDFFRAFGPAMALSILVALVVSVTLIPALMAVLGRIVFWPGTPQPVPVPAENPWSADELLPDGDLRPTEPFVPNRDVADVPGPGPTALAPKLPSTGRFVTWLIRPRNAAIALTASVVFLLSLSAPLLGIQLGVGFTDSLPGSNSVKQAAAEASAGFAPGITSPTTLLIEGRGVTTQQPELRRLQQLVQEQPGVAGILGPDTTLVPRNFGLVLAASTNAARMLVVMEHDPLGATAIDDLGRLRAELPQLVRNSGLIGATVAIAGDTALAEGLVSDTGSDLIRIAVAAILINLLMLVVFLRAVIAAVYLLAGSILALGAALGLTTLVFQNWLGWDGITFFVPFAAAVLLVSLGSDYNIFGVGHVMERARSMPLLDAIKVAVPESTRAITAAGITLAVSFGMLAVIPLRSFWELGFAMVVGIMLDAVLVRSIMMPCMLALVGPISGWPGKNFRYVEEPARTPEPAGSPADPAATPA